MHGRFGRGPGIADLVEALALEGVEGHDGFGSELVLIVQPLSLELCDRLRLFRQLVLQTRHSGL
jgi:hypothetical protein